MIQINITRDSEGRRTDRVKKREANEIRRLYVHEHLTIAEIASKLDRKPQTVARYLEEVVPKVKAADRQRKIIIELASKSEIAERKQLSDFISSFSLPSPFIRQATDIVLFYERMPGFLGYGETYRLIYRGQFPLPDLYEYMAWPKHPLFDRTKKLLGDSVVRLEDFIKDFGALLESCRSLLQQIYSDSVSAAPPFVKLDETSNNFVPYVYSDAIRFGLGDRLDPPDPRYYKFEPFGFLLQVDIPGQFTMASFENKDGDITTCQQIRDAHIRLREEYRASKEVGHLVKLMYGLEAQKEVLQRDFETLVEVLRSIPR